MPRPKTIAKEFTVDLGKMRRQGADARVEVEKWFDAENKKLQAELDAALDAYFVEWDRLPKEEQGRRIGQWLVKQRQQVTKENVARRVAAFFDAEQRMIVRRFNRRAGEVAREAGRRVLRAAFA